MSPMILAHGSGIDDAAFVVLPLLVIAALRWFNRHPRPQQNEGQDHGATGTNDLPGN